MREEEEEDIRKPSAKRRLWKRVLSQMTVRISLVILLSSAASYWHIESILKREAVHTLEKYIHERGEREQKVFDQVKKNQEFYLKEIRHTLEALTERDRTTLTILFKGNTELNAAGVRRPIRSGFDGARMSHIYVGNNYPHPEEQFPLYQILAETTQRYGIAYSTSFMNFYATTPNNILIGPAPMMATWSFDAKDDLDVTKEEYVQIGLRSRNPKRETAYTGVYFDVPGQLWMVTATTPYDDRAGQHLFNIGTDITIEEIFQRTLNEHLEGAFNFLVTSDGALIADKSRMEEIKKRGGSYSLLNSNDPKDLPLKRILNSIQSQQVSAFQVIDDPMLDDILAVYRLKGPNWLFVTSYSKENITRSARNVILFIIGLSLLSLIAELGIMFGVLSTTIKDPIELFLETVKGIATGDYAKRISLRTQDELATLANHFNTMIEAINERDRTLEAKVKERSLQLAEKNRDIQAILNNISQGIFTLSMDSSPSESKPTPKIDPGPSKHLEQIFQIKSMAGLSLEKLLKDHFGIETETLKTTLEVVTTSFGNGRIDWELNSHLLPRNVDFHSAPGMTPKKLALDWDAICNEQDEITQILVAVRDVTELRNLQEAARQHTEELGRIEQVLQVGAEKMRIFIESSLGHLESSQKILSRSPRAANDTAVLMRALHTLKGNARTLGFNRISSFAHDCEKKLLEQQPEESIRTQVDAMNGEIKLLAASFDGLCKMVQS